MRPTMGSLFAGIGGFDLGFERAGFEVKWQVEIDPYCRKVLARHFPTAERFEDVRTVGAGTLSRVDVICGGFPCQDISNAGEREGINGARSGLFFELARVVRVLGPRFVVLENVAVLLERGMREVLGTFADLGYDAEWSVVSGCSVGTTHMRRRVFIVAYPNGLDGWPRIRNTHAQSFGPLSAVDCFANTRAGQKARLANPSELYRNAYGISAGLDRNRAIGNAVVPQIPELIARRLKELLRPPGPAQPCKEGKREQTELFSE